MSELSTTGAAGEFGPGLHLGFGLYVARIPVLFLRGHYRVEGLNPGR